ncbi:hypothetical protein Dimus_013875, partial [Dionaea muscipula]
MDGFTAKFFTAAWGVVGDDLGEAVLEFFRNGKMLKAVNSTVVFLVAKKESPTT